MRGLRKGLSALAITGVVAMCLASVWAWSAAHAPLTMTQPVSLTVQSGASAAAVARQLSEQGVLRSTRLFRVWARLSGAAGQLKAGEYELTPGVSMKGVLDLLVAGRVKLYPFTILEGWTWRDVRDAINASAVVYKTVDLNSAEAMAAYLPGQVQHAEGQLFPDTYAVARGTTDVALLQQAAELMSIRLSAAWDNRAADLPLQTPQQLLTLASIIERETSLDDERAEVAGVFIRRLRKGMRLQTDPTVIYGLGDRFDGNLTRTHLLTDTPYNTYTRGGLPPTPIAMPGEASLQAAANPRDGESLFFVASAKLDGSHVFSVTLDEHNAAVAAYIAALRRARVNSR
jgi:UPF0755 protein